MSVTMENNQKEIQRLQDEIFNLKRLKFQMEIDFLRMQAAQLEVMRRVAMEHLRPLQLPNLNYWFW